MYTEQSGCQRPRVCCRPVVGKRFHRTSVSADIYFDIGRCIEVAFEFTTSERELKRRLPGLKLYIIDRHISIFSSEIECIFARCSCISRRLKIVSNRNGSSRIFDVFSTRSRRIYITVPLVYKWVSASAPNCFVEIIVIDCFAGEAFRLTSYGDTFLKVGGS